MNLMKPFRKMFSYVKIFRILFRPIKVVFGIRPVTFIGQDSFYKIKFFPTIYSPKKSESEILNLTRLPGWRELNIVRERHIVLNRFLEIRKSKSVIGQTIFHNKYFANDFLKSFISSFPESHDQNVVYVSAIEVLDKKFSGKFANILSNSPDWAKQLLRHVLVPITGSHGDLSCLNVIRDKNGEFHIIDLEAVNLEGSHVIDAGRFLCSSLKQDSAPPGDVCRIMEHRIFRCPNNFKLLLILISIYIFERAYVEHFIRGDNFRTTILSMKSRFAAVQPSSKLFSLALTENPIHGEQVIRNLVREMDHNSIND